MFFLLRTAFWLTIVLALLPTGSSHPTARSPQVGEAFSAAGAAVSDVRHFCIRQPAACEVGSQVAVMIGQRAQAGAKMLYDLFNEHSGPTETGSVPSVKTESVKAENANTERAKPEPTVAATASAASSTSLGPLAPNNYSPAGRYSERR